MTEITPTSIFLKLFPKSLLNDIAFHTNLYDTQIGNYYAPNTPNEIQNLFAINMFMSLIILSS